MNEIAETITVTEQELKNLLDICRNCAVITQGLEFTAKENPNDLGALGMWKLGYETSRMMFEFLNSKSLFE